ncbi:hypothetical protein NFH98_11245 [Halomonas sp. H33-56]|uniref:hypothetical protein n=1 Tax=Halomonas sp. H33-56 TaxID=2950873 RepID=UPI0032DEDE98
MKVKYFSQSGFINYQYSADGEEITATINGQTDTFDFSKMRNGTATQFETVLPYCPVIKAERVDGELTVHLITWYWGAANYENRLEGEAEL